MNRARRARSTLYLRTAWCFLQYACAMVERAEAYRRRAHAVDLQAYEQARDELVAQVRERMANLRYELAIREHLDARDEAGAQDEHGVRW